MNSVKVLCNTTDQFLRSHKSSTIKQFKGAIQHHCSVVKFTQTYSTINSLKRLYIYGTTDQFVSLFQAFLLADAQLTHAVPGRAEFDQVGLQVGRITLRLADDLLGRLLNKRHRGGTSSKLLLECLQGKRRMLTMWSTANTINTDYRLSHTCWFMLVYQSDMGV